jgi:streptothricin acetyltransferase
LLFGYAAAWARARGCTQMKIETQNINVAACRFYAAMGAELGDIRRFAYRLEPLAAHEAQLNWYLPL